LIRTKKNLGLKISWSSRIRMG